MAKAAKSSNRHVSYGIRKRIEYQKESYNGMSASHRLKINVANVENSNGENESNRK